jgi:protein tyrosine phosphatase (PTP) superfamily phosphohydrolase (DUF442 family)
MRIRFWYLIVVAVFGLFAWLASLNFHAVDDHQFFRSAQLSGWELNALIHLYGIKTVINLRGEQPSAKWFQDEQRTTAQAGTQLVSIDMNSREIPDRDAELKLIQTLKSAPRPILVHCLAGSDRTGEAAAVYEMVVKQKPKEEALKMLSPRFMHFDFHRPAQRYFLKMFQGEEWVRTEYDPCSGKYQYYDPKNPECTTIKQ